MKTTLGSVLFSDYEPGTEGFVVAKLRAAGAIFLGKATLGELGGGDTHGSLFGSTRNVYDLARTAGGSSGGSGRERIGEFLYRRARPGGLLLDPPASCLERHRRHAPDGRRRQPRAASTAAGRRRTARSARWRAPSPMPRSCSTCMAGYDPSDPVTAYAVGRTPRVIPTASTRTRCAARESEFCASRWVTKQSPTRTTSRRSTRCSTRRVADLEQAGAEVVDPIEIPGSHQPAGDPRQGPRGRRRDVRIVLRRWQCAVQNPQGGDGVAAVRQGRAWQPTALGAPTRRRSTTPT